MITINNNKAIEVAKEKIRAIREPMFKQLDLEIIKNITDAEKLSEIEAEKQKLRDMTKEAEGKTVEELQILLAEIGVQ